MDRDLALREGFGIWDLGFVSESSTHDLGNFMGGLI